VGEREKRKSSSTDSDARSRPSSKRKRTPFFFNLGQSSSPPTGIEKNGKQKVGKEKEAQRVHSRGPRGRRGEGRANSFQDEEARKKRNTAKEIDQGQMRKMERAQKRGKKDRDVSPQRLHSATHEDLSRTPGEQRVETSLRRALVGGT